MYMYCKNVYTEVFIMEKADCPSIFLYSLGAHKEKYCILSILSYSDFNSAQLKWLPKVDST